MTMGWVEQPLHGASMTQPHQRMKSQATQQTNLVASEEQAIHEKGQTAALQQCAYYTEGQTASAAHAYDENTNSVTHENMHSQHVLNAGPFKILDNKSSNHNINVNQLLYGSDE